MSEEERRREFKNILNMLLFVLPLFALMFVGWLNSPMYEETKVDQRGAALAWLTTTYWYHDPYTVVTRQSLMEKYNLTDDDIKPDLTHYNQNLKGSR